MSDASPDSLPARPVAPPPLQDCSNQHAGHGDSITPRRRCCRRRCFTAASSLLLQAHRAPAALSLSLSVLSGVSAQTPGKHIPYAADQQPSGSRHGGRDSARAVAALPRAPLHRNLPGVSLRWRVRVGPVGADCTEIFQVGLKWGGRVGLGAAEETAERWGGVGQGGAAAAAGQLRGGVAAAAAERWFAHVHLSPGGFGWGGVRWVIGPPRLLTNRVWLDLLLGLCPLPERPMLSAGQAPNPPRTQVGRA